MDRRGHVWCEKLATAWLVGDIQCCKLFVFRGDRHVGIYASPDNWRTCFNVVFHI